MTYYHYCSTEAFRQILTSKKIWLSSLTSSNDAMEGKWMTKVIEEVAAEENINKTNQMELIGRARFIDSSSDCLGFCLSEKGDTLSQWRGYADDGKGVSIGFNGEFLQTIVTNNKSINFQNKFSKSTI